jgi:hypothetical protein
VKRQLAVPRAHHDLAQVGAPASEKDVGEARLDLALDDAAELAGAGVRAEAALGYPLSSFS